MSFPISHSPTQNERVLYSIDKEKARTYVTCGERELRFGMQWSVEYSLGPDDQFLTQRLVIRNPGKASYPWMSWSNAALPSAPDTEFHFPNGRVLSHSSRIEIIDWAKQGPKRQSDIHEMTGYFWITRDVNSFGAYTDSRGTGLYHIAEEMKAPGMKLWSYGIGEDADWAATGNAGSDPYIEIQGGPMRDQSVTLELRPNESSWHAEYWIPTDKPLDILSLTDPAPDLRPIAEIALYGWAREQEVVIWQALSEAHASGGPLPEPPHESDSCWPPSGLEDLDAAFEWAIMSESGERADLWRYHFGTWLAGRGQAARAIEVLETTNVGVGNALLARLLVREGDFNRARGALERIEEPWIQLHPQVVVERDRVLRALGPSTAAERELWLSRVVSLEDEWIGERRVQLLLDRGKMREAKELLLSIPFQKVHQSYARTNLWIQVCEALGEPHHPAPRQLGEDHLAHFGAYREHEPIDL